MKTLIVLLLLSSCLVLAGEPLKFTTLTTSKGVVYKDVKVSRFDVTEVRFIHADGAATVLLGELPADVQKIFGYDPVGASFIQVVKSEERSRKIVEEAERKERQQKDAEELRVIKDRGIRCFIRDAVLRGNGALLLTVDAAEMLPKTLTNTKADKRVRFERNDQGKTKLYEQISPDKKFVLGETIQVFPKLANIPTGTFATVYLIQARQGKFCVCAMTPEDALEWRRKLDVEQKGKSKP